VEELRGFFAGRARGERKEGEALFFDGVGRGPGRRETPREHGVPPWINPSGSAEGTRLFRWEEIPGAHGKGWWVFFGSAGGKGFWETGTRSPERRKALKGKPQERWGLKEALADSRG
jgi:hypothetical protein